LFVRCYSPEQRKPTRTICWVHGLGEHGGRYEHVIKQVNDRGWRVVIADLRGHGRSSGTRTHVKSFDQYVSDVALIWNLFDLDACTVLLGLSMGGLIAIRAVQSGAVAPSALVVSSPLLGVKVHINSAIIFLGSLLLPLFPTVRFSNRVDPANM